MKLNILTELKNEPWGGGNQFLKALRDESIRCNSYSENIEDAQIILFNSHHNPYKVLELRERYKKHIFVHRVDGPMSYRGRSGVKLDKKIFFINSLVADGTVFQSEWSRNQTINESLNFTTNSTVIHNAPDPKIFYNQDTKSSKSEDLKIKLITSSWSNNPRKGFDYYHYLDKHLDFDKYSMSFAGNIDKSFSRIRMLGSLDSIGLAEQMRKHDIFIFASEREACSNSLLEALHTGLPVVCRNTSSNPEVVKKGGIFFDYKHEMLEKIDTLSKDYLSFKENISVKSISEVFDEYMQFFSTLTLDNNKRTLNFSNKIKYILGLV